MSRYSHENEFYRFLVKETLINPVSYTIGYALAYAKAQSHYSERDAISKAEGSDNA